MVWPFWILVGLVWLGLWVAALAARASVRDGDDLVATFSAVLLVFCASTCLGVFLAVPAGRPLFHQIVLWVHHTSIFLLFLFLLTAEYLQAEAWWRVRRGSGVQSVVATLRRLWVLTEIVPAPVALTVLLTGLRLIWDSPEANSPSDLWLFGLILGFSLFFWDGILGYQPIVRRMWQSWRRAAEAAGASPAGEFFPGSMQLFGHFLSWPLVFVFGVFRWNAATPLTRFMSNLTEHLRFLPAAWPEVTTALLIWLVIGIVVYLCRAAFRPIWH